MADEDLRALEHLATSRPDDAGLLLRLARARARAGLIGKAALALARLVDHEPRSAGALGELDALTRGGMDPEAPWPCEGGDARGTRRSVVAGPTRGEVVARQRFPELFPAPVRDSWAVGADGSLLVTRFESGQGGDPRGQLVSIAAGAGEARALRSAPPGWVSLLAGWTAVKTLDLTGGGVLAWREGEGAPEAHLRLWLPDVLALGHVVAARGKQGVLARPLVSALPLPPGASPAHGPGPPGSSAPAPRGPTGLPPPPPGWSAPVPRRAAGLAVGPGALVHVLTDSGLGARGSLHRFALATGKALPPLSLERVGKGAGAIVVDETGTAYLGLGTGIAAVSPDNQVRWREDDLHDPVGLAGERSEVLVAVLPRRSVPRGLDRETGRELWASRDQCLNGAPRIDARGVIYWRREQELVAIDPLTGRVSQAWLVGDRYWEFTFGASGRIYALRRLPGSSVELVVLE